MLLQNPFFQEILVASQVQKPVGGILQNGSSTAQLGLGIDQVGGTERGSTFFTLISIGMVVAAFRTSAFDVAVSKKLICLLIVVLSGALL